MGCIGNLMCETPSPCMQVATILGTVMGRFTLELSPRMGGYSGLLERQTIAFTLAVDDGLWIKFKPRPGWI